MGMLKKRVQSISGHLNIHINQLPGLYVVYEKVEGKKSI